MIEQADPPPPTIERDGICPCCYSTDVSRHLGVCWSCEGESPASTRGEP